MEKRFCVNCGERRPHTMQLAGHMAMVIQEDGTVCQQLTKMFICKSCKQPSISQPIVIERLSMPTDIDASMLPTFQRPKEGKDV